MGMIFRRQDDGTRAALARLRELARENFRLDADAVVMVNELACGMPGCPPVETVFAFWPADGARRQFKVFKAAQAVEASDLPPWWLRDALIADGSESCC